ncbi:MAG: lipid-binding SYLF domain-containing protein [Desulforhopalus sp.]
MMTIKQTLSLSCMIAAVAVIMSLSGCASPAKDMEKQNKLENDVDLALAEFKREAPSAMPVVDSAKGLLVCPNIAKGGLVVGVEGGTCALRVGGKTVDYYRTSSLKAGLLAGVQSHALLLTFNTADALAKFREGNRNWQVGGNLSVTVAKKGASGAFDTKTMTDPITGFVFSEAGLMADISLDGSTFKKLEK